MRMAQCLTPITITNSMNIEQQVPCGKCPACKARRASAWSFRLMQEDKRSTNAQFITLTYSTNTVPITKSGFMVLNKRHLQLFFKRLRRSHEVRVQNPDWISYSATPRIPRYKWIYPEGQRPIKYYAVGEYGTDSFRPHYHIILFNHRTELVSPAWNLGHVHYGTVSEASVGYTLKYISKPGRIPLHRNDDRIPEFSLMSKGLGENYLTPAMVTWHKNDLENRMYCNLKDGKKISMPRYYKLKMYDEAEKEKISVAARDKYAAQAIKEFSTMQPNDYRNKKEKILDEFRQAGRKATKGRNKI